jgi:CHASE3 domain sensor protein
MPLLNRKVQLAFMSSVLTLFIAGGMSYRAVSLSNERDRWVRHTHEVIETLQDLLSVMRSLESSNRGFALTGNEPSLGSYRANVIRLGQEETALRKLIVDNVEQQHQQQAIEKLAARKIQFGDSSSACAARKDWTRQRMPSGTDWVSGSWTNFKGKFEKCRMKSCVC